MLKIVHFSPGKFKIIDLCKSKHRKLCIVVRGKVKIINCFEAEYPKLLTYLCIKFQTINFLIAANWKLMGSKLEEGGAKWTVGAKWTPPKFLKWNFYMRCIGVKIELDRKSPHSGMRIIQKFEFCAGAHTPATLGIVTMFHFSRAHTVRTHF